MSSKLIRRPARAFTLIELIVVIIILGILAAVVLPRVLGKTDDARVASTIANITSMSNAIDQYKADTGKYPTTEQGLNALLSNPGVKNWDGPYLKNTSKIPNDAWGHPFTYKQPGDAGREYDISSGGPDEQPGTPDDIQSWNLQHK